jgi:hypothetical protein
LIAFGYRRLSSPTTVCLGTKSDSANRPRLSVLYITNLKAREVTPLPKVQTWEHSGWSAFQTRTGSPSFPLGFLRTDSELSHSKYLSTSYLEKVRLQVPVCFSLGSLQQSTQSPGFLTARLLLNTLDSRVDLYRSASGPTCACASSLYGRSHHPYVRQQV